MITNFDVDFSEFSNGSPLVTCSIGIVDSNQCGRCMGGDVVLFDKCSVNGAAGASAVN